MKSMVSLVAGTLLITGAMSTAALAEHVERTESADADGRVLIENLAGSVVVRGWDRGEISVEGELGRQVERLDFDVSGGRAHIKVVLPKRVRNVEGSDLVIQVPHASRVEVETVSATIEVEKVTGALKLESISGDVEITGTPKSIECSTVSGEQLIEAETSDLECATVSGQIEIRGASGDVSLASVSGDLLVDGTTFERVQCESVSGSIEFRGELAGSGRFDFESHSGRLEVLLVGELNADFDISTFSGDIRSELGPRPEKKGRFTPGRELRFTVGDGDARVSMTSFSGTIELDHEK